MQHISCCSAAWQDFDNQHPVVSGMNVLDPILFRSSLIGINTHQFGKTSLSRRRQPEPGSRLRMKASHYEPHLPTALAPAVPKADASMARTTAFSITSPIPSRPVAGQCLRSTTGIMRAQVEGTITAICDAPSARGARLSDDLAQSLTSGTVRPSGQA